MPEYSMTPEEMRAYLNETHVAHLVTLKRNGSPHVAPLWYQYDNGNLYMITGSSVLKTRNIRRDSRVAVAISTDQEPYRYVLLEGNAEIGNSGVEQVTRSLCIRYRGQEEGAKMAEELLSGEDTVILIVHPTKIITWKDG